MPAAPAAKADAAVRKLWEQLSPGRSNYTTLLYGTAEELPPSNRLRIVWLPLMSTATLQRIRACACTSDPQNELPFYWIRGNHPSDSLWVHDTSRYDDKGRTRDYLLPSYSWVEVTH